MSQETYTTAQVANVLNLKKSALLTMLHRHPELKPTQKHGDAFVWIDQEIEQVKAFLATPRRGRTIQ